MMQFIKKPFNPVKRVLLLFCILHAANCVSARLFWKPVQTSDELVLPWSIPPSLMKRVGETPPPPADSSTWMSQYQPQQLLDGSNMQQQSNLMALWTHVLDDRGTKRSEGHPCYMPAVTSTNIPASVTATVESIKSKIEMQTDIRIPGRRLPTNCYNYDLDAAGIMIASRIRQYHSLLKWFQLIRERYGMNTGSLVWTTNSTFDSITHCLQEMQQECTCDHSSITPNSYIINNCMIAPPTTEQSNQAALMLNSLDEFTFILESVSYYVSLMKQGSPEGTPLCSNSS